MFSEVCIATRLLQGSWIGLVTTQTVCVASHDSIIIKKKLPIKQARQVPDM